MKLNDNDTQTENNIIYLVVKFKIKGTLRFLSHSQILSVFQRAIVRAEINLHYSQGFNPRPKISLPLPRPVGVESDDELLVMGVVSWASCPRNEGETPSTQTMRVMDILPAKRGRDALDTMSHKYFNNLSAQLPDGCELQSLDIVRKKPSFQPCYATYIFTIRQEEMTENMQNRINSLLTSESLIVKRSIDTKNVSKKIDVKGFLTSIIAEKNSIIVRCKFSAAGSIRIQEIMELLELDTEKLAGPIKRTNVQWQE